MLQKGNFWLLDEPTASLDARSEKLVMKGLENKIKQSTTLIVTHQLSQLKNVEQIFVMQEGCIVESGSYQELKQNHGLFASMLDAKNSAQEEGKGDLDA
jgi:ATP-binding cassette subfamily C protein CydD